MIKNFYQFNENILQKLTLYHGTSNNTANYLIENGWIPRKIGSGGNMGNPRYLYVTTEPEDARWFSNQIGEDTVVEIKDIPLDFLRPDPEDEAGFTMKELLNRKGLPSKFIIIKELDKKHFRIYEN